MALLKINPTTIAALVEDALDHLWTERDHGCCPDCCQRCGAVKQLRDGGVLDRVLDCAPHVELNDWWIPSPTSGQMIVDRVWLARMWDPALRDCRHGVTRANIHQGT
jgi:hypothetical protein